ncbi:AMP-binding protein [Kutzneria chonburiensis]|uniref:Phenyloxazoline synthase MbtB n=1 Tax=Kutzneria chonburiensis TaxID=1483604 RepID=A0ABV6MK05_9PSEU|nr:AMP-binding protein [Kutzneria chonburiensis]
MTISVPLRAESAREPNEGGSATDRWRAYLADAPADVDLPFTTARIDQEFRAATVPIPALVSAVAALRDYGGDADAGWLVALAALVSRFTGQQEIVVGSPAGDRATAQRVRAAGELSFAVAVAAMDRPGIEPIAVDTMTELMHSAGPAFTVGYVRGADPQPWPHATVSLLVSADGMPALGFDESVVDSATMAWFAAHLATLMTSIMAEPDVELSRLDILAASERHRIVVGFNDTARQWEDQRSFAARVADVAAATPDAVAVTYRGATMTYRELDSRANQLAWHLLDGGVTEGDAVALFLERSPEAVIATLAVLRIAAVVVPLDPADNDEWIAYMVRDSAAAAIITDSGLSGRLPRARHTVRASARVPMTVLMDTDAAELAAQPDEHPPVVIAPTMTSHVVYTSGSTGVPKGALADHRGLINMLNWMPAAYRITAESRGTWICAPGFAIGRIEWMPFVAAGAQVHIADAIIAGSPERTRDWMRDNQVSHTLMVTSFAQRVCALPWTQESDLQYMIMLGEPVRRWPRKELPFAVTVSYGSTEAAVVTSTYDASTGADETSAAVPTAELALRRPSAGHPVANTRVYLLDAHRAPVPVGAAGEIYVAGDGVCTGYLNLGAETSERFVPTSLVEESSPTLFRTGDLGRWRADGSLEALGREDSQTWVHGVRVEVGEIEAVFADLPEIREVAVVARDGRLIAYLVPADHRAWEPKAVLARAGRRLAAHQIPEQLVRADSLPRLANGKLDRQKLPAPPTAVRMVTDRAARFSPFPLTDTQQERWIARGDIVGLSAAGCHRYWEWECEGLDVDRFRLAWHRLVDRHDALRTVILPDATQQVLADPAQRTIPVVDLRWRTTEDAQARVEQLRAQLAEQPRSSGDYPLWDVRLTQMPGNMVRVHLCLDQLIVDAWSYLHVLVPELTAYYADLEAELPEPALSWRDYVMSLAVGLESTMDYKQARRYWMARMDRLPAAPALPSPTGEATAGATPTRREVRMPAQRWSLLKNRAAALSVTPSGIVTAAFAEVLRAWSSSPQFTVNLMCFPRIPLHHDVSSVLGEFSTSVLVAVDPVGDSFAERALSLQRRIAEDVEHAQYSGFRAIREHVGAGREPRPVFPVVLTDLLDQPLRRCRTALGTVVHTSASTPQVLLDLQMSEVDGALTVALHSVDAAYPAGMAVDMTAALRLLLDRLVDDADCWRMRGQMVLAPNPAMRGAQAPVTGDSAPIARDGAQSSSSTRSAQ